MGLGYAAMEEIVWDEGGQLATTNSRPIFFQQLWIRPP